MKEVINNIVLKFANVFSGPRLKVLLIVLGIFLAVGLVALSTLLM